MRQAAWLGLLVLAGACDEPKAGEACSASSRCAEKHVCLAAICVEEGSRHLVDITLVPSDHDDLACGIADGVAGLSCSHDFDQQRARSTPAREDAARLQPVTTKKGVTLLAARLWQQPALRAKLDRAKPDTRFTASCHVVVRGSVEKARVHWKPGQAWQAATHVPIVVADTCTVE